MELDNNPFYRNSITQWYDSNTLCWVLIIIMISVLVFSGIGLNLALENPDFHPHIWVPTLLTMLAGVALISITGRMIRRHRKGQ